MFSAAIIAPTFSLFLDTVDADAQGIKLIELEKYFSNLAYGKEFSIDE